MILSLYDNAALLLRYVDMQCLRRVIGPSQSNKLDPQRPADQQSAIMPIRILTSEFKIEAHRMRQEKAD